MNAELVKAGDTIIGTDGKPLRVVEVEHVYQGEGPTLELRQVLVTLEADKGIPALSEQELSFLSWIRGHD